MEKIQSIRGMHDVLPADSYRWQWLEKVVKSVLDSYGFSEIRTPIVESTGLFLRSIGEVTDIVEKEMYTFEGKGDGSFTLRPEGTASCVRSGIQHGLFNQGATQKIWYNGPMFRYERPQKGRYRQFHQIGVEHYGIANADTDAEILALTARLWQQLGITDVTLEINALGDPESRQRYREALVEYFSKDISLLDEDSKRRLHKNPLRILDTKNPALEDLVKSAPLIADYLDEQTSQHFKRLQQLLSVLKIPYIVNPRLVRGIDYYTSTVFEWTTDRLGAQDTICAGGRYDGLVEQLGGKSVPAVGFAMGVERLLELVDFDEINADTPLVFCIALGNNEREYALQLIEQLRNDGVSGILVLNTADTSVKSQMKKADKSLARYAVIIGENELANKQVTIKALRTEEFAQQSLGYTQLLELLRTA